MYSASTSTRHTIHTEYRVHMYVMYDMYVLCTCNVCTYINELKYESTRLIMYCMLHTFRVDTSKLSNHMYHTLLL